MLNERIDTIRYAGAEVVQVRAEDGYDGGTLVLGVARLGLAVHALAEWLESRFRAEFLRPEEAIDLPAIETVLGDLRELHVRGLNAALNEAVCSP